MQILGFGANPNPNPPGPTPLQVSSSVRFNPADTAYFSYIPTLQGSRTTWTWSGWVKRSVLGNTYQELFGTPNGASDSTFLALTFGSNGIADTLGLQLWFTVYRVTTQVFRDPSQWYHILCAVDTTQSTAADRIKLYVNGTQITAFSTSNNPAQFAQLSINAAGSVHAIGRDLQQSINFGGYLADVNFVDGQALTPAAFTETDTATGQLIPLTYAGSYGVNGFYLPFGNGATVAELGFNPKTTAQDYPYWPYNTLLINSSSTNGAQNNTFLDSSTNNFAITRNGNTTQGNFTPFNYGGGTAQTEGYYSGYFDGTGDYVSVPSSAQLDLTGDFTIEMFFLMNNATSGVAQGLIANGAGSFSGTATALIFGHSSGPTKLSFFAYNILTGTTPVLQSSTTIDSGQWYHVAITRSGSTMRLFVNGQEEASYSSSATINLDTTLTKVGSYWNGDLNGYISSARVVKGTAVYTANFTVPITPLTAIANTSLLTCQNSQFIDNSTNAFAVTTNGNARPVPTNPFGMTDWSGAFDGTDYLTIANNAALDPNTDSFCIECWVYITSTNGANQGFGAKGTVGIDGYVFYVNPSLRLEFEWIDAGARAITGGTLAVDSWNHVAVVRNSGVIRLYLNGVGAASSTACTTDINSDNNLDIGRARSGNPILGYISNYRMTKGALPSGYDATISTLPVPTAPLTAISGTVLLTCQSSTFIDNSPNAFPITVNGNAYTLTFANPFNNSPINYTTPPVQAWSTYFDGSGDYISTTPTALTYGIGTGLFTWESWIYTVNSSATAQGIWHYYTTVVDIIYPYIVSSTGTFNCQLRATNQAVTTISAPAGVIRLNQWHHVVVTRDSATNISLYVDGKKVAGGTIAASTSFADTVMNTSNGNNPVIGAQTNTLREYFYGYISNLRFVKGTAVYTANFTPPTAPLTAIPGTMTLACQSNRVRDNSIVNAAQVANGNTAISPVSPFIPTQAWSAASYGGSMYLDGTGDNLLIPSSSALDLPGDFTIECWVNFSALSTNRMIIDRWSSGVNGGWQLYWRGTGTSITFWVNAAVVVQDPSTTRIQVGAWNHIAVVRSGTTCSLYINGEFVDSGTLSLSLSPANLPLCVGEQYSTLVNDLNGYVSGVRILKGTALYTSSFVPPVLPPTAIANTALLLNATNSGIYDAAGENVIETVGNAQVSTAVKKWGDSSVAFDGTGDYLVIPSTNAPTQFGSQDFTIEAWVYSTSIGNQQIIISNRIAASGNTNYDWQIFTSKLIFSTTSTNICVGVITLSSNTWYHVAVSRVSGTTRQFVNGVLDVTSTTSYNLTSNSSTVIGGNGTYQPTTYPFVGYIQDLRVTKGAGRYQGAFTPPAAAFAYNQYDISNQQWTPTNISVTAGTGQDNLSDSPSDYGTDTGAGGEVRGNYATLNPLNNGSESTLSNGALDISWSATAGHSAGSTIAVSSGKWYAEFTRGSSQTLIGIIPSTFSGKLTNWPGNADYGTNSYGYFSNNGNKYNNSSPSAYGASYATGDVIGVALDLDAGTLVFYKNGVSQGVAYSSITGSYIFAIGYGAAPTGGTVASANFGQRAFAYAAPTGFKCLVSTNLPTPTIGATSTTQASDYVDLELWTGTGANRSITGFGFAPDFVWIKGRSQVTNSFLFDILRGATNRLCSSLTVAQASEPNTLTAFNSDGFSLGTDAGVGACNLSGQTYVGWCWKANGAGSTNTDGSITSTVSANTTSGCSVVTWTGNGTNGATIGHGLGVAPVFTIIKSISGINSWYNWHQNLSGNNYGLSLNTTDAQAIFSFGNLGTKTSTTLQLVTGPSGADNVNLNGRTYVAYCFAAVAGYSAFGSYTGNGSADGPFVYLGFRPTIVLYKRIDSTSDWWIMDRERTAPYNIVNGFLYPNSSAAEGVADGLDFLSNGFKVRRAGTTDTNASGGTYIYAAFAEFPFKYARAR